MKVINLFAGPGVGKSTTGAVLYGMLSMAGYVAEYVPEFAKFASFANNTSALKDQIYMFGKQHNRLDVLRRSTLDFVVMDGPLPLACLHTPSGYFGHFEPLVMEAFASFDNVNFFLERSTDIRFQSEGRNEDELGARLLCERTEALLLRYDVPFTKVRASSALAGELFVRLTCKVPPLSAA